MRFIFVLSDGALSLIEIRQYLRGKNVSFSEIASTNRFAIFEIPGGKIKELANLGGTFKIGDVSGEGHRLAEAVDSAKFGWLPAKLRWSVSYYSVLGKPEQFTKETEDTLAEKVRDGGAVKSRRIRQDISEEGVFEVSSGRVDDDFLDIILARGGNTYYQGRTIKTIPYESFIERDLDRPYQESSISIPPRLARILVNLLSLSPGKKILDPFCGTGTILMESLSLGMQVYGVDSNIVRINGAKDNLRWLAGKKGLSVENIGARVKKGDARRLTGIREGSIDGIATEPILVPRLSKYPDQRSGSEMLERSSNIYLESLRAMQNVLRRGGIISIVTPFIRVGGGKTITFDFRNVVEDAGLSVCDDIVRFPLFSRQTKDAKVQRAFWLLRKD